MALQRTRERQNGPDGAKGCQMVPEGGKECQMALERTRECQNGPKGAKGCQMVPEGRQWVPKGPDWDGRGLMIRKSVRVNLCQGLHKRS